MSVTKDDQNANTGGNGARGAHADVMSHPANSADVVNPLFLQLPCSVWWNMDEDCVKRMNRIQLQFAADILKVTSAAYEQILSMTPVVGPAPPSNT